MPRKTMSKIGDPKPIVIENVRYQSHQNYVEAVDVPLEKVLWHTVLYPDFKPKHPDSRIEHDVQWTIVVDLKIMGDLIEARDGQKRTYRLDRQTGKILPDVDQSLFDTVDTLGRLKDPSLIDIERTLGITLTPSEKNDSMMIYVLSVPQAPWAAIEFRKSRRQKEFLLILTLQTDRQVPMEAVTKQYGKECNFQPANPHAAPGIVDPYCEYTRPAGKLRFSFKSFEHYFVNQIVLDID